MSQVKVIIYDPTGSKKTPVELPNDVPMRRLIPALVTKMGLPTTQGANPITYRLDHRDSGRRLSEEQSLNDAGVKTDDILSLFPEVTAG
ncbi:MAG: EsaB/YukD family protein [Ardenticatenaceae bacterium]|nr:EsaB/YukD family protein [Ardenticatenaceae bacterium]